MSTARPTVIERDTNIPSATLTLTVALLLQPCALASRRRARIPRVKPLGHIHAERDSAGAIHAALRPTAENIGRAGHEFQAVNHSRRRHERAICELLYLAGLAVDKLVAELVSDSPQNLLAAGALRLRHGDIGFAARFFLRKHTVGASGGDVRLVRWLMRGLSPARHRLVNSLPTISERLHRGINAAIGAFENVTNLTRNANDVLGERVRVFRGQDIRNMVLGFIRIVSHNDTTIWQRGGLNAQGFELRHVLWAGIRDLHMASWQRFGLNSNCGEVR